VVRQRKAFTTLELLIAIGIIIVLAGMLLLGLKAMVGSTTGNSAQIGLQNARAMMAELETRDSLTNQLGPIYGAPVVPFNTVTINAPEFVTTDAYEGSIANPQNNGRFLSEAVASTQRVMAKLRSMPSNRDLLEKTWPDRLLRPQTGGLPYAITSGGTLTISTADPAGTTHGHPDPPILVDSWNNPIIFVPPGGLVVAFPYDGAKNYAIGEVVGPAGGPYFRNIRVSKGIATSDGTYWEQMPPAFSASVVRSPDGRPFFASAGPDGNFQSPDDNLYSFEN
jgi:type II secretory pathway pseudopilin PulG